MTTVLALGAWMSRPLSRLFAKFGGRCYYCNRRTKPEGPISESPTRDHLVPRARGGAARGDNEVLACQECNEAKGKMTDLEFLASCRARLARGDRFGVGARCASRVIAHALRISQTGREA